MSVALLFILEFGIATVMDKKTIDTIITDLRRFFSYAGELGAMVSRLAGAAGNMKKFVDLAVEIGEKFTLKSELVMNSDLMLRDQLNTMHNACSLLNSNVARQKEIIAGLRIQDAIDSMTEKRLMYRVLMLSESIQNALGLIRRMLDRHNGVILLDQIIAKRVGSIDDVMNRLRNGGRHFIEEATGGWSEFGVFDRGGAPEEIVARAARAIQESDTADLKRLVNEVAGEVRAEGSASETVATMLPVVEGLSGTAADSRRDSSDTQKTIDEKNVQNLHNLDEMGRLSIVLSIEIEDYKKLKETIVRDRTGDDISTEMRNLFRESSILFTAACNAIENLVELNHYTVELFKTNTTREEQVREIWTMYRRCHDNIWKQSEETATHLRFLSEGLKKNGIIGRVLEKNIRKLL